ncbi:hypothetical protein ACQKWADRAFT_35736 [Trichoderma austrokoningii]
MAKHVPRPCFRPCTLPRSLSHSAVSTQMSQGDAYYENAAVRRTARITASALSTVASAPYSLPLLSKATQRRIISPYAYIARRTGQFCPQVRCAYVHICRPTKTHDSPPQAVAVRKGQATIRGGWREKGSAARELRSQQRSLSAKISMCTRPHAKAALPCKSATTPGRFCLPSRMASCNLRRPVSLGNYPGRWCQCVSVLLGFLAAYAIQMDKILYDQAASLETCVLFWHWGQLSTSEERLVTGCHLMGVRVRVFV